MRGLGVHICPHIVCALMMNFEIALSNLISDEEKLIFDVLAVLACAHPTVLCQQYGGLIILVDDIILNCISLRLHEETHEGRLAEHD